ncbi:hypothetical protein AXF42_Ash011223 [Apostasia shenzhenica]|uniref:Glycoside hydrolase family 5 domain-containing protein n=1 Tax=Apostasia shenzhenica TaxID=1088818 RepID=A0A2I0AL52_9ASPA|nr:hypothetical protein AXF42_Ash011223 [Apostasia shenzhenica]
MRSKHLLLFFFFLLISHSYMSESLPLLTSGRWIVDASTGRRVKLRCVNWAAHLPAVVAEGLDRQPLESIAAKVASLGFNCVRLTWATHHWTDDDQYANLTVAGSLLSLGLRKAAAGIAVNNPRILSMTVRDAYEAVVRTAADTGLMLVLDNHVSRPQWCCGEDDGNGFFGDTFFDADEWLRGLEIVARRFRPIPQVVGLSLRNELRGKNQTISEWRRNMARGCDAIHSANPDLLVVVSGLSYDTDLSFLAQNPLQLGFGGKLVLEIHTYAFSRGDRQDWTERPLAAMCSRMDREFEERAGFVARGSAAVPLFVSEFGGDQTGTSEGDNRFLSCFLAMAAQRDLDWALWALQGSYYIRNGKPGFEETFGVLDGGWSRERSPRFRERFRLAQEVLLEPGTTEKPRYVIVFHPESGGCLTANRESVVQLGDCEGRSRWEYEVEEEGSALPVRLIAGTEEMYLAAAGEGRPVVAVASSGPGRGDVSRWRVRSVSGFPFQIAGDGDGAGEGGKDLCLERAEEGNGVAVLAKECVCLKGPECTSDPRAQWFVFVASNV